MEKEQLKKPQPACTLLVYVEVPERMTLYLIRRSQHAEILADLRLLNRVYINASKVTKAQQKAVDRWFEWSESIVGKSCVYEPPIHARIVEVLELGFAL